MLLKALVFFFFNDTATTEIYTLSLHDALPISWIRLISRSRSRNCCTAESREARISSADRKSTRLNSSHSQISYAVFCLKKKEHVLLHLSITRLVSREGAVPRPTLMPNVEAFRI